MGQREDILAANDLDVREEKVPEWNTTVWIKALSGEQFDAWRASQVQLVGGEQRQNLRNVRAKLLVLCLCGDDGELLFPKQGDAALLGRKSSKVIERLSDIAAEMSGVTGDLDKAIEDAEGNSDAALSGDSTSPLPSDSVG